MLNLNFSNPSHFLRLGFPKNRIQDPDCVLPKPSPDHYAADQKINQIGPAVPEVIGYKYTNICTYIHTNMVLLYIRD